LVLLKLLHIIKRDLKTLKNNILVAFLVIFILHYSPIFSQSDTTIERNFSDSITKKCQIVIFIPNQEFNIVSNYFRLKNSFITYSEYSKLGPQMVTELERDGYPFASIFLDSMRSQTDTVFLNMKINKSKLILYDSIVLKGDLKLSNSYLKSYLNFKKGKRYNEQSVQKISRLISELSFSNEIQPSGIDFVEDKANLFLFLNKKKVNQFDGIIGFAPQNQFTGKIGFTGELKLLLVNTLHLAEFFNLHWQAPESSSQLLDIATQFNYLLSTPFGFDAQFHLDKKDTSYLKMNTLWSLNYSFNGNNYIKTFIDYTFSNILQSSDESNLYGNFNKTMYGIACNYKKLDYIYNPRKGIQFYIQASAGKKNNLTDEENQIRYEGLIDGKGFIPIYKNWILVLGVKSGIMSGDNLFKNEFYRIGGMNSLQGFDELSLYANSYSFGLIEIRYKLNKMSYINGFFNGGWYEQDLISDYFSDTPYGFGVGFAFETRAGIFNMSYALGSQQGNPISFKTGKIHFGISVQF